MTPKEFVKRAYPKAVCEKHKKGMIKGLQETYWLIRPRPYEMYIGRGATQAKAWREAASNIPKGK